MQAPHHETQRVISDSFTGTLTTNRISNGIGSAVLRLLFAQDPADASLLRFAPGPRFADLILWSHRQVPKLTQSPDTSCGTQRSWYSFARPPRVAEPRVARL